MKTHPPYPPWECSLSFLKPPLSLVTSEWCVKEIESTKAQWKLHAERTPKWSTYCLCRYWRRLSTTQRCSFGICINIRKQGRLSCSLIFTYEAHFSSDKGGGNKSMLESVNFSLQLRDEGWVRGAMMVPLLARKAGCLNDKEIDWALWCLLIRTLMVLNQSPSLMTSFNLNFFTRNAIALGIRTSTYKF